MKAVAFAESLLASTVVVALTYRLAITAYFGAFILVKPTVQCSFIFPCPVQKLKLQVHATVTYHHSPAFL